nr:MAG: putative RNA-dependent RNA polymerase [Picobirnavirus sp.]
MRLPESNYKKQNRKNKNQGHSKDHRLQPEEIYVEYLERCDNADRITGRRAKVTDTSFSRFYELPNSKLVSYLRRSVRGQDVIYHGPWIKAQLSEYDDVDSYNEAVMREAESILSDWKLHLDKLTIELPGLKQFEDDLASKVGPMSVEQPLDDRLEGILDYYNCVRKVAEPLNDEAIRSTIKYFHRLKGTHPRGWEQTLANMKLSTNSGSPYFSKRRLVVDKSGITSPQFYTGNKNMYIPVSVEYTKTGKRYEFAATLGWRGQEGGADIDAIKQRTIWMFPLALNVLEHTMYQPMIELCQKFDLVPAWVSMESVDEAITRLFDTKGPEDVVVCTDFTKFDQHFNRLCQDATAKILSQLIGNPIIPLDNWYITHWLTEVFPIKYRIPLVLSEGKVIDWGLHGMASGSGGTNFDETVLHKALQFEAALSNGAELNPNSMCLGDDGILSYPGISAEQVTESYSRHGLDMNPDKQSESKDECVYLRRWHSTNYRQNGVCVGVYSTCRALGRLLYQERYYNPKVWSKEMVALRQLSILENVKYHPLKEEFLDWCIERDKYRLGLDIPGFLDNVDNIAKRANEQMPDFLGYTKSNMKEYKDSSLSSWWVVQALLNRR